MKTPTGVLVLLCGVFLATTGSAQVPAPAYGVGNQSVYLVDAWNMTPATSSDTWSATNTGPRNRYTTNGGVFYSSVEIPRGARILRIELDACDTAPAGKVFAILERNELGGVTLATAGTSDAFTGGCLRLAHDLDVPETVDGARYIVTATNSSTDGSTSIGAVRVFYDLQVSPAPATATFNDVPVSDQAFQFIEALVSSGVTAGCGGGNYCPDAPLTRRQMAVFLAKLLGLNWPESIAP